MQFWMSLNAARVLYMSLLIAGLSACGGGGSSGGGSATSGGGNGGSEVTATTATITPFMGKFSAGSITLSDANGAAVQLLNGTGTISASGAAQITYPATVSYPLLVSVTGTYQNGITGSAASTGVMTLRGLIPDAQTASQGVPVTAITEIAVARLEHQIPSLTGISAASAISAITNAGNALGLTYQQSIAPPVFDVQGRTTDPVTMELAALSVLAAGRGAGTGTDLLLHVKGLAKDLAAVGPAETIFTSTDYRNALAAVNGGASSLLPAGALPVAPLFAYNGLGGLRYSGSVSTASRIPLAGAEIAVLNPSGAAVAHVFTDSSGNYTAVAPYQGSIMPVTAGYTFSSSSYVTNLMGPGGLGKDFIATGGSTISGSLMFGPGVTYSALVGNVNMFLTIDCGGGSFCSVGPTAFQITATGITYAFSNMPDGHYPLTIQLPTGYAISPLVSEATIKGANVTQDLTINTSGYIVSGKVVPTSGYPPSIVVSLGNQTVWSDSLGNFSFRGVQNGTYTVTATLPSGFSGYTLTPGSLTATVNNADVTGLVFSTTPGHVIMGWAHDGPTTSAPIAGADVVITGPTTGTLTTAADGSFSFIATQDGTYTVAISKTGSAFCPASQTVTVSGADVLLPGSFYLCPTVSTGGTPTNGGGGLPPGGGTGGTAPPAGTPGGDAIACIRPSFRWASICGGQDGWITLTNTCTSTIKIEVCAEKLDGTASCEGGGFTYGPGQSYKDWFCNVTSRYAVWACSDLNSPCGMDMSGKPYSSIP